VAVWIKLLVGFVFVLIMFMVVDYFLAKSLQRECIVSDRVALSYKMIDMVEFAKLNAKQAFKFAINKSAEELGMSSESDLKMCTGDNTFDCNFPDESSCNSNLCCKWDGSSCVKKSCNEIEESAGCDACGCSDASSLRQEFLDKLEEKFDPSMLERSDIEARINIEKELSIDSSNNLIIAELDIEVASFDRQLATTAILTHAF